MGRRRYAAWAKATRCSISSRAAGVSARCRGIDITEQLVGFLLVEQALFLLLDTLGVDALGLATEFGGEPGIGITRVAFLRTDGTTGEHGDASQ